MTIDYHQQLSRQQGNNARLIHEMPDAQRGRFPFGPAVVAEVVRSAALRTGFRQVHFQNGKREGSFTGRRRIETAYVRSNCEAMLLVRWRGVDDGNCWVEWAAATQHGASTPISDNSTRMAFERWLTGELSALWGRQPEPPPLVDPIVRPGERPPLRYSGQIYDYSGFATSEELEACHTGSLPIGREAFGWKNQAWHGERLFLPPANNRPREELGILLCAPQGSGKTHLLLQWAAWAAQQGRSVFIIDVKGNMRRPLEDALNQIGVRVKIQEFTTAADESSDSMNVLAGISADDVRCSSQLMQIAETLLPEARKAKTGEIREEALWKRVALMALHAALMLLKLIEYYGHLTGAPGRIADLSDLSLLIKNEETVITWIVQLRRHEAWALAAGAPLATYRIDDCVRSLDITLPQGLHKIPIEMGEGRCRRTKFFEFTDGQRSPERTYKDYMIPILTMLEPFVPSSALAERVRSTGNEQEIRLDRLGRDGVARIVLLAAREQDSKIATDILATTMLRLTQCFNERRTCPKSELGEVLLLLDETSRIEGFDAPSFVSIVRENRIGYVLVYQGLDMIGPPAAIDRLLGNIGTQVFLKGLAGEDLSAFNRRLAGRDRERRMETEQTSPTSGPSRGSSLQSRDVPFLQPIAANPLPAGRYPALVYLRDGPPPFLVDLHSHSQSLRRI